MSNSQHKGASLYMHIYIFIFLFSKIDFLVGIVEILDFIGHFKNPSFFDGCISMFSDLG